MKTLQKHVYKWFSDYIKKNKKTKQTFPFLKKR